MKKLLLPFYLIHCLAAASQAIHYPPGTLYTGLGAYSRTFTQSFSFLSNQAALAGLTQVSAGLYAEQKYGLKELSGYMATVAIPVAERDGVGFAMQYAGFGDYNQSCIGLAYGKDLGRISIGVQCNYNMIRIAGYGNDAALGIELGSQWQITQRFITGIHIANPLGARFKNSNEKLAAVYGLGAGYEVSPQLFLSAEVIREEDKPVNVQAGIQYNIIANRLLVRTGLSTATTEPFAGIGCQWKNCRADVNLRYHPQLGFTPGLLLLFYGKTKTGQ